MNSAGSRREAAGRLCGPAVGSQWRGGEGDERAQDCPIRHEALRAAERVGWRRSGSKCWDVSPGNGTLLSQASHDHLYTPSPWPHARAFAPFVLLPQAPSERRLGCDVQPRVQEEAGPLPGLPYLRVRLAPDVIVIALHANARPRCSCGTALFSDGELQAHREVLERYSEHIG